MFFFLANLLSNIKESAWSISNSEKKNAWIIIYCDTLDYN